ncbi:glycoside hydrolase family 18 protein [Anaeromicropila herbilytica]|uniref:Glycosyl hydrolase n=1 Tax=Anaeromicropila herbilytica TaxID=2785025 RepID=A0A7R7EJW3_9FIRM|nr:glycosyl hydrolase family 18 protein [Anaeromicropila herbilytica]BCN30150.1 hypothetical protein bsdtb5_14450 [Anaeromicropila herbilytica]
MKSRIVIILYLIIELLLMTGCSTLDNKNKIITNDRSGATSVNSKKNESDPAKKLSVWITYWDSNHVEKELGILKDRIGTISYFAVYFNEHNEPFIREETTGMLQYVKQTYGDYQYQNYLTFVNDLVKSDGTSSLKDTNLLRKLFATKESRSNHIDEIIHMVKEGGYSGIEIDYEAIKKDITLWNSYIQFIKELYQKASGENLPVRIILEPNVTSEEITLPKGPKYIMMCYNLYGYGTAAGPKANPQFIKGLVEKMTHMIGKIYEDNKSEVNANVNKNCEDTIGFALATGGFDFADNEKVTQLTQSQAVELMNSYETISKRDKDSQCQVFTYKENGIKHEVWYADNTTIKSWMQVIDEMGDYEIVLWRLGSNVDLTP